MLPLFLSLSLWKFCLKFLTESNLKIAKITVKQWSVFYNIFYKAVKDTSIN